MAGESVIGLDLSLTRTGSCLIPSDWGGDVSRCTVSSFATKPSKTPSQHVFRLHNIANFVLRSMPSPPDNCHAFAESVPSHGAFSIGPLSELRGFVMSRLYDCQDVLIVVDQRSARTLFIGPHASAGAKELVKAAIKTIPGTEAWNSDECDAFVVANYAAYLKGWRFVRCEVTIKTKAKKTRKPRAAKPAVVKARKR